MNKKLYFCVLILPFLSLCSCDSNSNKNNFSKELTIYSLNDSHGDLLKDPSCDSNGYDAISTLIKDDNIANEDNSYFTICTGDMFQGQFVSNKTRGEAVIDALNYLDCKAFVLGNHEYDWGIDELKKYKDGDLTNGELNCEFLGANIIQKSTNKRPSWIKPYTIVEQNGHKIGIIGFMGEDLESSILTERIEDYEFVETLPLYEEYSKLLKETHHCDLIVVGIHDYDRKYLSFANAPIPPQAIFGGHTHRYELTYGINQDLEYNIPFIQSACNNEAISKVKFSFNSKRNVIDVEAKSIKNKVSSELVDTKLKELINTKYSDVINEGNEVLTKNLRPMNRTYWTDFVAKTLLTDEVDGGCINKGGVRYDTYYTYSTTLYKKQLFRILPFDNKIYQVKIDKNIYDNYMRTNSKNKFAMNENKTSNPYYIINVIDYVFTHVRDKNIWSHASVIKILDLNIRDYVINYLKNI